MNFTHQPVYPHGYSPQYPMERGLVGPQTWSWCCSEDKILCLFWELHCPQPSHYTDWAILAPIIDLLLYQKSYRCNFLHLSFLSGAVVPALGLVAVGWFGCDRLAIMLLLVITGGFTGATYAGNQMNHITLSPHYAGTLYGITNAAANVCGFLAPYVVGLLINGNVSIYTPHQEWDMLWIWMYHFQIFIYLE